MGITVVSNTPTKYGWVVNATTSNASDCEELRAAPSSGSIILDYINITSDATLTVTIGAGETTGAVTTILIGPIPMIAGVPHTFYCGHDGIKLAATTSLTVDASGAGNLCIFAYGRNT